MRPLLRDLRHAVRSLTGRPILAATTVLTLAIGIGGTTTLVALSAALLRPLPWPDADRVVRVFETGGDNAFGVASFPNLDDVARRARSLDALAIHQQTFVGYGLGDDTITAAVELVSGPYFRMVRIPVAMGRPLSDGDDREAARVAVVSDRWWRTRLGADPAAIGRVVHLNGAPFTVVGIAPPLFHGSYDALGTDLWVPLTTYGVVRPRGLDIQRRGWGWLQATARLAPGVSLAAARAEIAGIASALQQEYPRENRRLAFTVVPAALLPESMGGDIDRLLAFVAAIAVLALLAACANVANASLAGVGERGSEIAVRMALGASTRDIARLWIAESLVASGAATVVGVLMAVWARDALLGAPLPAGLENLSLDVRIDWIVAAAATGLMALATCLAGVLPARRAARTDPAPPLRDGAASSVGGRGGWLRSALVSAQSAAALALVALAALLGQSLWAAGRLDLGFDRRQLVVATANLNGLGLDDAASLAYHDAVMARIRALPGVEAATAAAILPLGGHDERRGVAIEGYVPPDGDPVVSVPTNVVWPGYFEVMRIPLVEGRPFRDADARADAPLVAVVNRTMAQKYWPSGRAVGGVLRLGADQVEVVGVVGDGTYFAIGEAPMPFLYLPYGPGQPHLAGLTFHVRTVIDPAAMVRQLTRELRAPDPRVRVEDAMTYDALRAAALLPTRAMGWLSVGFGVVALALLAVGVYGVTAYSVAARRRELVLRVALGAHPDAVRRSVVGRAVVTGLPGLLAGLALATGLGQLLRGVLVGVAPIEPWPLVLAAGGVLALAAIAAYLPVRRVGLTDLARQLRR
ncbi:MAG: ADOP family duplicated permease [Vicinamibacterales bacterium]